VDVTRPVTVRIEEVVLDGFDDGAATAALVQAEVARALAERQVEPAERVAAEVGPAVERSVRS
jgi:hypothetical protein